MSLELVDHPGCASAGVKSIWRSSLASSISSFFHLLLRGLERPPRRASSARRALPLRVLQLLVVLGHLLEDGHDCPLILLTVLAGKLRLAVLVDDDGARSRQSSGMARSIISLMTRVSFLALS